eukprot:3894517-Rhodomonas_salina.1
MRKLTNCVHPEVAFFDFVSFIFFLLQLGERGRRRGRQTDRDRDTHRQPESETHTDSRRQMDGRTDG